VVRQRPSPRGWISDERKGAQGPPRHTRVGA
jgi:peroxiredoxin